MSNKAARDLTKDDKLIELLVLAENQGWEIKPTNNGKLMWYPKDKDMPPVTSPMRLIGRSLANVRTALERSGLDTSSLKGSKPKKAPVILATSNKHATPDTPLTPHEERHSRIQELTALVTKEGVFEALPELSGKEQDVEQINLVIDTFILNASKALIEALSDVRTAIVCSHDVDSDLQTKLDEAERLYLETCQELETERKRADRLQEQLSKTGTDFSNALKAQNEALDRANKAENRLRALRSALTED